MKIKTVINWLPLRLIVIIIITSIIASFDGIIYAEIISRLSNLTNNISKESTIRFGIWAVGTRMFVFLFMYMSWKYRAKAVKILNTHLKYNFSTNILISEDKLSVSESISKVSVDYKTLETNFFAPIFEIFGYALMFTTSIIYILKINFIFGGVFILISLISLIPSFFFNNKINKKTEDFLYQNNIYLSKVKDLIEGVDVLKIYHCEDNFLGKYKQALERSEEKLYSVTTFRTFISILSSTLSFLGRFIPVLLALFLINDIHLNIFEVIAMFVASDRIDFPIRMISQYVSQIKSTETIRENIVIINNEYENKAKQMQTFEGIDVNDVSYSYGEKDIFKSFNLSINKEDKILITGSSGKGKSTLLQILMGNISPQTGGVYSRVNGKVESFPLKNFDSVSVINQKPIIFNESIRYNISFSDDNDIDTDALKALEKVNLIDELGPNLLDIIVEEDGLNLSGGQIQRIEIARALFHNPKIVLIDEMTSALDNTNSKLIRKIFWNSDLTIIEVAHHYDKKILSLATEVIEF
ncbi:ABC transporter ATP-binding protein [Aerococcaceae bacterium zg-BR9]|uniref:ATP-binding cassette domain-containing protein n=1 Tax=Aerococcaceae bacterium zg-1292 TaxID=2774330 RepID=UPI00406366F6|nr:ABC transporter ATP-binding protein [Aerococcaceae bacterium zg-BR9]